ncbi:MAG: hypothetical protein ACJ8CR_30055 [Roseiflexaceae bacterium]
MRISPNHPRLRLVALGCWAVSGWCMLQGGRLAGTGPVFSIMVIGVVLLALLLLAVGVAFWQIGLDRRAGIVFDAKGLLLNLGHSTAFIAWENIERVGVSSYRASVLALGSRRQLGIRLRDTGAYVQSYENRLPAAPGPLARGLRLIQSALRPFQPLTNRPITGQLAQYRAETGYDVLVPEALLGGHATAFAELLDIYRLRSSEREVLGAFYPTR